MDDTSRMGRVEALQDCANNVDGLCRGESSKVLQQFPEGDAGKVLHDDEGDGTVLPLVKHVDNVGMGESRGLASFLDKTFREVAILGEVRVHDFDGHRTLEPLIHRLIDGRHATASYFALNEIALIHQPAKERISRWSIHSSDCTQGLVSPAVATPLGQFIKPSPRTGLPLCVSIGVGRNLNSLGSNCQGHGLPPCDV